MNKKYKKQVRVAMAITLAVTSITYSIGSLFAQSEETINEDTLTNVEEVKEENIEREGLETEVEVVEESLESKESIQHVEKAVGDVAINASNFPDAEFREYIRTGTDYKTKVRFDTNGDGVLSRDEIANITSISMKLTTSTGSVQGIEYFPNLTSLSANGDLIGNGLTSIDVSRNLKLQELDVNLNKGLKNLDVSKNTELRTLICGTTGITSIDVSKNLKLEELLIHNNRGLGSIDLSKNKELRTLWCYSTNITNLDVSKNTKLGCLNIGSNSNLNVTKSNSVIDLDGLDNTFSISTIFPDIETVKIYSMKGASLSSGVVSGYTFGTPITYKYDCGTDRNGGVSLDVTLNVRGKSSITIDDSLDKVYDGQVVKPSVTTTGSNGAVTFEWYKADGTKLQAAPTEVGSYKVKVILAEDNQYIGAEVEETFSITKAISTITINDDLNKAYDGQPVVEPTDIVTTGSTGTVTFEWYTVDGTQLPTAPVNAGSYKVKALLAGDGNHEGAEVEKDFTITKATSTITINDNLNKVYDGQPVVEPIDVVTTGSNGAVTFEWYKADGTLLQSAPVNAGDYKVKAILAENTNYADAEVEKEFTITKVNSTITINDDLNKTYDGVAVIEPTDIVTTGSNGAITFEWYTADGTLLTNAPVNAGSYKVKAILAGDTNYAGAEVEKEFTITKANSTITINDDLNKVYDGQEVVEPQVTTTGSTGIVTFEWYTADGTPLTSAPVNVGSYKVKAILVDDANHIGVEVEKEFTITKATTTITINDDLNKAYDGQQVLQPTDIVTIGSNGAITFEWYTADGTLLQSAPVNAGSYKVKAILAEDTNYAGVEVEKEFTITQAASTIVITVELNKVYDGLPVSEPQVTVTGSTGAITYEWYKKEESTTRAITWTKLSTAPSEVGNYKVVVTVAGDGNFEAITVEKEFSILGKEVVPTPGTGGTITNPDGTEGPVVNPGDKVESNGPAITNPDGSITFPNGGTITKPDGSVVIIQPGATFKPNGLMVEGTTTISGVQTGDSTQVGLWTMLIGLSTGVMMFFRKKNRKEEV